MKTLIITANPISTSFTNKIAESFKKGAESVGKEVNIIDLYDKENHQDYLKFDNPKKFGEDKNRKRFQELISNSDEIVFAFPVWWGDAPAIMKNFLDTNLEAGFAFKYTKRGVEGLLKNKKARVYATCDAPGFFYKLFLLPLNLGGIWGMYRLSFCGIKKTKFKLIDKMRKRDENNRIEILKKIENDGKN